MGGSIYLLIDRMVGVFPGFSSHKPPFLPRPHPLSSPRPVRGSQWADGGERFATVCDAFGPHPSKVQVFFAPEDADPETREFAAVAFGCVGDGCGWVGGCGRDLRSDSVRY